MTTPGEKFFNPLRPGRSQRDFTPLLELKLSYNQLFVIPETHNKPILQTQNSFLDSQKSKSDECPTPNILNQNIFTIQRVPGGLVIFFTSGNKDSVKTKNEFKICHCSLMSTKDIALKLKESSEWLLCLKFCIDVNEGIMNSDSQEKEEMKVVSSNIVTEYLMNFRNSEASDYRMIIRNSMEVLIKTDNYELLFGKFRKGSIPEFYWDELRYFVQRLEIDRVPYNDIEDVITGLGGIYGPKLLWFLSGENTEQLLVIAKRQNWNALLIGIGLRRADTIPFILSILLSNISIKKNKPGLETEIFRLFWLIRRIVHFGSFPSEIHDERAREHRKILYDWLFDIHNLTELFSINSTLTENVLMDIILDAEIWNYPIENFLGCIGLYQKKLTFCGKDAQMNEEKISQDL
jgi:hypothetical protein